LLQDVTAEQWRMNEFFGSVKYNVTCEWSIPLEAGDFWKLVLCYDPGTSTFSVVFGKRRSHDIPESLTSALDKTLSNKALAVQGGVHKDIEKPVGFDVIGWAQYIVLSDSQILIGWYSIEYWYISRDVMRRCLEQGALTPIFLSNTSDRSEQDIYSSLNVIKK
jgi:hypothetical protein